MNARLLDLTAARRQHIRAQRLTHRCAKDTPTPSVDIEPAQLAAFTSPRSLQQLVTMLDGEVEFTPRATLIERLRFTRTSDEFCEIVRITLERAP